MAGLALDEPEKTDTIMTVNDIPVAMDPGDVKRAEALILDAAPDGKGMFFTGDGWKC
ncbi:hypothetical protein [Peribacillus sp. SCS-37]|uniref:hypothetical protein n=1 Tax=Paraperibacillus esterisolvens TaxID=3115296 RepID=UPI0039069DDF